MPLERAIREFRFAYGADSEARKMRQPPGTLALDSMPSALVDLFRRAFLTAERPPAREWAPPLEELAEALKKCELHEGHYFYRDLRECPWCEIELQAGVRLFNFLFSGADARRGHFRLDEIWKEIVSVQAPHTPQIQRDKIWRPSAEVATLAAVRNQRFNIALLVSAFTGLATPLLVKGPAAYFLFILAGLIAYAFARAKAPLLDDIQARQRRAKDEAQRLQEQYDRESGNERWDAKLDELRNRKETYENLAQMRQARFQQLETEARQYQLEEYLDQFKINDAEIKGVVLPIKTALLSHGFETAADVIDEVKQIPSVGRSHAERLFEWRRGLEQKFVFDPARCVPHETRFRVEREVEALRFRLETELICGARRLRHIKQEVEANIRKLQPVLAEAHRELDQTEKDLEVAGKRSSVALILMALFIAFIAGLTIKSLVHRPHSREAYSSPAEKALRLTSLSMRLTDEGKFEEAVEALQEAVRINPKDSGAYEHLGFALYRLERYEESVEASKKASELRPSFESYYNSGLAYMELGRWDKAKKAFELATWEIHYPSFSWEERHTLAYYYMARSTTQLGEAGQEIKWLQFALEGEENSNLVSIYRRLHLGCLYLWVGKREAARAQYEILKDIDPKLAEELLKLIAKHGEPT